MVEAVATWKAQQRAAMEVQLQLETESLARLEEVKAAAPANPSAHNGNLFGDGADESAWNEPGMTKIAAGFTANVWDIKVKPGDKVGARAGLPCICAADCRRRCLLGDTVRHPCPAALAPGLLPTPPASKCTFPILPNRSPRGTRWWCWRR
jgi:hypothetical protein